MKKLKLLFFLIGISYYVHLIDVRTQYYSCFMDGTYYTSVSIGCMKWLFISTISMLIYFCYK